MRLNLFLSVFLMRITFALHVGACAFAIVYGSLFGVYYALKHAGIIIPKASVPVSSDQSGDFCPANMRTIESILGATAPSVQHSSFSIHHSENAHE